MPISNKIDLLAYIDESGAKGLLRNLIPEKDREFGLLSAVVFPPNLQQESLDRFGIIFEKFKAAAPAGSTLHITEAFKPGNEKWAEVAKSVRSEISEAIFEIRPVIIYSARRLRLARAQHERTELMRQTAEERRSSKVVIPGSERPSDARVEDDLVLSMALLLDAFATDFSTPSEEYYIKMHFDELDAELAKRYQKLADETTQITESATIVKGYDKEKEAKVVGKISMKATADFELDTKRLKQIEISGKDDPLVFVADIVANSLNHHLLKLSEHAPLNQPSSIAGWSLEERVWGLMDNSMADKI